MSARKRRNAVGQPKSPRGASAAGTSLARRVEQRNRGVGGWRGETLARLRALILDADPEMTEERKWIKPTNPSGVPVWSHAGIVCTGETYKNVVKLTFFKGAQLKDPKKLFNASLEGNARRAIDFHEGDPVDEAAFAALICEAVALNTRYAQQR